ncbi:MAG: hypothetical protein J5641_02965 [Bacteroidales bacterium]|nr:hypothetical protein [Bacteroidales bacterium]
MDKKFLFLIVLGMLLGGKANGQSYSDAFDKAFNTDNVAAQREALAVWQKEAPDDVNLFIARYNYYANRSIALNAEGAAEVADMALADSGLVAIEEGIRRYPDRLDMRFGKIFFLGELRRWDAFEEEIMRMLDHSVEIDHRWSFPNVNEGMEDLVSEAVYDYMSTMFDAMADVFKPTAEDNAMRQRIQRVARRSVQLFPADVNAIYTLAVSYIPGDLEKAMRYLKRAVELAPANKMIQDTLEAVRKQLE